MHTTTFPPRTTFSGPRHLERAARAALTEAHHFVYTVATPVCFELLDGESALTIDGQHPDALDDLPQPIPGWRHRETVGPRITGRKLRPVGGDC
jgi:hypothetical protein